MRGLPWVALQRTIARTEAPHPVIAKRDAIPPTHGAVASMNTGIPPAHWRPIPVDRLAETTYAQYDEPGRCRRTHYGRFVFDPRFPGRWDACQLFDARCAPGEVDALLDTLETLHEGIDRPFRRLVLHDEATAAHLIPALRARGWSAVATHLMPWEGEALREASPEVEVRATPFDDPDGHRAAIATADGDGLESLRHRQSRDPRLGGEALVGFLDSAPVGRTGWFVVDGVARFRPVRTIAAARERGVATSLIRHVQRHPAVRAAEGLVIFCDEDGPAGLYEQLGFVKRHVLWSCLLERAGFDKPN